MKIQKFPMEWFERKRDYSASNLEKFRECMESLSFCDVLCNSDSVSAFNDFYDMMTLLYEFNFSCYLGEDKQ